MRRRRASARVGGLDRAGARGLELADAGDELLVLVGGQQHVGERTQAGGQCARPGDGRQRDDDGGDGPEQRQREAELVQ